MHDTTPAPAPNCYGCSAAVGDPHRRGCGYAVCRHTGRRQCDGEHGQTTDITEAAYDLATAWPAGTFPDPSVIEPLLDALRVAVSDADCRTEDSTWTGYHAGTEDCIRLGLWAVFDAGWRPVPAGTPGAEPDLNRLLIEGRWDVEAQRWELP
jgi:hypothetical protein